MLERQAGKNMTNYQVGDFLIRLKNASLAGIKEVVFPANKLVVEVAKTLKREGFLDEVEVKGTALTVRLSIYKKKSVLQNVKVVSRPGLRIYINTDEIESTKTPEVLILTTPKGIMSGKEALKKRVGGELIAKVI